VPEYNIAGANPVTITFSKFVFEKRGNSMKMRFAVASMAMVFGATLAVAATDTWTGYIADSKCGAQAAHEGARECTIKCVKEGAQYVFVDDAGKKVYPIADRDQDKVVVHAGHHVTIKGSLEGDTIDLSSIEMAPAKTK
jgi:hypothetical protein